MDKLCKRMPENEQVIHLIYTKNAKLNVCATTGWHLSCV